MIFDEATSALDVNSERIVQTALHRAAQSRTTIIIAHRLSTIRHADQIVVVANGQVLEQGSHESLVQNKEGAYWRLVNMQTLNTREASPTMKDDLQDVPVMHEMAFVSDQDRKTILTPGFASRRKAEHPASHDILKSFAKLLSEQKANSSGYIIMVLAASSAAGEFKERFFQHVKHPLTIH